MGDLRAVGPAIRASPGGARIGRRRAPRREGTASTGGGVGASCRDLVTAGPLRAPRVRSRPRRRGVRRGRGEREWDRRRHPLPPGPGPLRRGQAGCGPALLPRGPAPRPAVRDGDPLELLLVDHLLPQGRLEELRGGFLAAPRAFSGGAVGGRIDVPPGAVPCAAGQAGRGRRDVARDAGALPRHAVGEVRRRASRRSQTVTPFTVGIPVYNEEAILVPNTERLIAFLEGLGRGYEVLIGSNGSTDSTTALGADLSRRFSQVTFFHLPERGVGPAYRKV